MSNLKLSELKRLALWQAHHRKCVYCGEPVKLGELDIDHILPDALHNSESEMARIKSQFELSADFDLNSFLNLVPTHHRCNLQKRDRLFSASAVRYFLDLASGKERTVRQLEEQLALQSKKERLLSAVRVAFERGNVATADLLDTAWSQTSSARYRGNGDSEKNSVNPFSAPGMSATRISSISGTPKTNGS